ncbi:hypothetical protein [Faecalibacter macacae]|uniref:Uncharacterized protein n=1 Tax=Faecalibacter macacae TaxID=1859289 RepID=A0A3L9M7Y9_9FLAO|nr:hypothetical protein [Faecalibacter macacae]RLZ09108.1 hypothetical protein EAH69_08825 [Faecalibacter macacae]
MLIYKNYDESTVKFDNQIKYSFYILNLILVSAIIYILIQEIIFEFAIFFIIYWFVLGYYIYKKTLSVEYFELHDEYILTKGFFDRKWKNTPIQEITYDYNYKKEVEYLTIHLGDKLFEFEASSNLTITEYIESKCEKNIFYKHSWKYYFYHILCFSPFLLTILFGAILKNEQDQLMHASVKEKGLIEVKDQIKEIRFKGRSASATIDLIKYNEFDFSYKNDSIRLKKLKDGDSIKFYLSPYEYERKIMKTEPLNWYDKYYRYKYISIEELKKL